MFWPFTVLINCSSNLKLFANSQPSASNFKSFSQSLEYFLPTVGRNNFGNKKQFFFYLYKTNFVRALFSVNYSIFALILLLTKRYFREVAWSQCGHFNARALWLVSCWINNLLLETPRPQYRQVNWKLVIIEGYQVPKNKFISNLNLHFLHNCLCGIWVCMCLEISVSKYRKEKSKK